MLSLSKNALITFFILLSTSMYAQDGTVCGNLADNDGLPLPTAVIFIKGSTIGTTSDFDGNYCIQCSVGDILQVSFVGYTTQEILVTSKMMSSFETISRVKQKEVKPIKNDAYSKAVISKFDSIKAVLAPDESTHTYIGKGNYYYKIKNIEIDSSEIKLSYHKTDYYIESEISNSIALQFTPKRNLYKTQTTYAQG
ncbi:MAG: carboxypeptidase-like regulatory domain-containing protein, partial [Flavobacteriaceae bacterium]|nr:carboxypeptidase-like regulatory domain-containing protein [Flavobacteriaceae bacterium]